LGIAIVARWRLLRVCQPAIKSFFIQAIGLRTAFRSRNAKPIDFEFWSACTAMGSVGSADLLSLRTEALLEKPEVAALAGHGDPRVVF
jgi:hypothetical protein